MVFSAGAPHGWREPEGDPKFLGSAQKMVGRTVSHYRIEAELGRGGMGTVYRAHDDRLRRNVALKLLTGSVTDHRERRTRILAEARAASALNHPGITTVFEVGEDGEHLFIVMELLDGSTLRQEITRGRMEPAAIVRIMLQVSEALGSAHMHGVIHGDIKPENIIVQPDGRVKLLDFGIARHVATETVTLTSAGTEISWLPDSGLIGTLAYMSPEQMRGKPAGPRSDLFGLGVVIYEMAAGYRPFPGPTATALMAQVLNDAAPPLVAVLPPSAGELARIVHKLLEKQPESRYQGAHDLHADLTNLERDLERGFLVPAGVQGKRTVAVLPFKLLTPSPEDEYLGVALADAVINQLSSSGDLLVRPTSTVMRYAKQVVDPLSVARELNVQVIVDGSIQKFGTKLRVHVQALNAADGSSLLSAKHDSDVTDLFGLQDKTAEDVCRVLISNRTSKSEEEAPAKKPTEVAVAYELYLRACERMSRLNRWDTRTAIDMLESATQMDSKFADAWARLAGACVIMAGNFEPGPHWIIKAEKAMRRALALDRKNANAQWARGRILWTPAKKFQNRAALRALGEALKLSPGHQDALVWKCLILLHVGLLEEAKQGLDEAMAANPENSFALTFLAQTSYYMGKYDDAEGYFAQALARDPASIWTNVFLPALPLFTNRLDRVEERIRTANRAVPGDPILASYEAILWAKRGEKRRAEQAIVRALKGKSLFHTHHTWHYVADAYTLIGKPARAVALLRKASAFGLPNYPAFRDDPFLAPLHNYSPFLALLEDLKREWTSYRQEFSRP
jgi:serine/threonine protein kinase/tetratricopeptide (TPR) repeat protein